MLFFFLSVLYLCVSVCVVIGDGNDGGARWNLMGLTPYEQKRQTLFPISLFGMYVCVCVLGNYYEAMEEDEKCGTRSGQE